MRELARRVSCSRAPPTRSSGCPSPPRRRRRS
jgi:hypothetical protein